VFVVEALQWTAEDDHVLKRLTRTGRPVILAINKVDRVRPRERLLPWIAEISRRFATKGADKFAGLQWRAGSNGAAIIDGVLGYVECKIAQCHDGGDHTIVVGEIVNVNAIGERPLLFFKGKYQRLPN